MQVEPFQLKLKTIDEIIVYSDKLIIRFTDGTELEVRSAGHGEFIFDLHPR